MEKSKNKKNTQLDKNKIIGKRDHPEQYPTEKESLFDKHKSELHVDPLPVEDINIEIKEEKQKQQTKKDSSSKNKYK